jgi:hypothetical protein
MTTFYCLATLGFCNSLTQNMPTVKLLLVLASTVIIGSEPHGTHDLLLHSDGSGEFQTSASHSKLKCVNRFYMWTVGLTSKLEWANVYMLTTLRCGLAKSCLHKQKHVIVRSIAVLTRRLNHVKRLEISNILTPSIFMSSGPKRIKWIIICYCIF